MGCIVVPYNKLANKVHDNQMQNHMGEYKVGESTFRRDARKYRLVLWICLEAQADGQDEAADGANEAREERVEGECAHKAAVNKLDDAGQQNVAQVDVHHFQLLRCVLHIVIVEFGYDATDFNHFCVL